MIERRQLNNPWFLYVARLAEMQGLHPNMTLLPLVSKLLKKIFLLKLIHLLKEHTLSAPVNFGPSHSCLDMNNHHHDCTQRFLSPCRMWDLGLSGVSLLIVTVTLEQRLPDYFSSTGENVDTKGSSASESCLDSKLMLRNESKIIGVLSHACRPGLK